MHRTHFHELFMPTYWIVTHWARNFSLSSALCVYMSVSFDDFVPCMTSFSFNEHDYSRPKFSIIGLELSKAFPQQPPIIFFFFSCIHTYVFIFRFVLSLTLAHYFHYECSMSMAFSSQYFPLSLSISLALSFFLSFVRTLFYRRKSQPFRYFPFYLCTFFLVFCQELKRTNDFIVAYRSVRSIRMLCLNLFSDWISVCVGQIFFLDFIISYDCVTGNNTAKSKHISTTIY